MHTLSLKNHAWMKNEHLLVFAFAAAGVLLFQALHGPQPIDDAFITYRYARSLTSGAGFVYNLGEKVLGTTTPLYTLILSAFAFVFGTRSIPAISFIIALVADTVNIVLLYRLAHHILKDRLVAVLLSACFLLQPVRLDIAVSGMETSLFITALLLMYHAYLVRKHTMMTAVWAALSIWIRPDAVLAIIPIFIFTACKDWKQSLRMGLLVAAILLPWTVFAWVYFGSPIPQSILAKNAVSGSAAYAAVFMLNFLATGVVWPPAQFSVLIPGLIAALYLAIAGFWVFLRRKDPSLVLVAYPILYYLIMFQQKPPMHFNWYYVPLMPGYLLLFWAALQNIITRMPIRWRVPSFLLVAVMLVAIPFIQLNRTPGFRIERFGEGAFQAASMQIHPQTQQQQVVFAPDIGAIGWELDNAYILDSVGLVSPQIIEYYEVINNFNSVNPDVVAHFRPDFVILHQNRIDGLLPIHSFADQYRLIGIGEKGTDMVYVYARKSEY
jgi:uncharacterized membrane protein